MNVSLDIILRSSPACFVAKTRRNLRSEKVLLPTKLNRSISTKPPSKTSNTKSTRLSERLIALGVTLAASRPFCTYASTTRAASCSAISALKTRRGWDWIAFNRASVLSLLFPSKTIWFSVGNSTTKIFKVLPTGSISTRSNKPLAKIFR